MTDISLNKAQISKIRNILKGNLTHSSDWENIGPAAKALFLEATYYAPFSIETIRGKFNKKYYLVKMELNYPVTNQKLLIEVQLPFKEINSIR